MSRKKVLKLEELRDFRPETIGDRVNYIVASKRLSATDFSKLVGISTGNLNSIINDDSKPSAAFMLRILELFKVDINWLLTGIGQPFVTQTSTDHPEEDPELADLLAGARTVLTSGNQLAFDALARNIQYFSHAIETERRLNAMESRVASLEEIIKQLTARDSDESLNEEAI